MYGNLFYEKGLSLDRLKCLLEVADAGSIVKAADRDPVKQSQFSRQIKELEAYFKCELTQRVGKSLKLTREGKELVSIIRGNFIALNEFKSNQNLTVREVSIGAGDSILQWTLIPMLSKLKQEFPDVKYSLHNLRSKEINNKLSDLSLDIGIVRKESVVEPLSSTDLTNLDFLLYAPKTLIPLKKRNDVKWILSEIPIATQVGAAFHKQLLEVFSNTSHRLNIELNCESYTQAYQALKSKCYAAILPSNIDSDINIDDYIKLDLPVKTKLRSLVLAYNTRMISMKPYLEKIVQSMSSY